MDSRVLLLLSAVSEFLACCLTPSVYYVDILLVLSLLFPCLADCYDFFRPFYMEKLEPHVEEDLLDLRVNIFSSGFAVVILYAR